MEEVLVLVAPHSHHRRTQRIPIGTLFLHFADQLFRVVIQLPFWQHLTSLCVSFPLVLPISQLSRQLSALSSGRFAGSKSQGVGRWAPAATRFIVFAPIFPILPFQAAKRNFSISRWPTSDSYKRNLDSYERCDFVQAYYFHAECLSHDTTYFRRPARTFESMLWRGSNIRPESNSPIPRPILAKLSIYQWFGAHEIDSYAVVPYKRDSS